MRFHTTLGIQYFLYTKSIKNLGTEKHSEYLRRAAVCDDLGCFAMTELGHGSNVQSVETTAHYEHETRSIVLNSPTETSIKFWIGNLAKTATMAVTFAQLIVKEENLGVHVFLVPIRDPKTHDTFEGCLIGDCGDKIGLQGIDNGWIKFTNYKIDSNLLLNRFGDIDERGEYVSPIPSNNKRFAFHMAALSGGRVLAASNGADISLLSTITAIRYGATRRQFARKSNEEETHIIDYPLHQSKIIPRFARGFMDMIAITNIWEEWKLNHEKLMEIGNKSGEYYHCLTSIMKPICTWNAMDNARESRAACGGLGYSAYSNFGEIAGTCEANQTWEGENYVMTQQTIRLILKNYSNLMQGCDTMKTLEWMTTDSPDDYKFEGSLNNLNDLSKLLAYRANKLVHESIKNIQIETMKDEEERLSKNEIWEKHLNYTFIPMAKAYGEHYILLRFIEFLEKFNDSESCHKVLTKLALLNLHNKIIEEEGFYRDIISKDEIADLKESCIKLNKELRPEVVGLSMALPFNDQQFGSIAKSNLKTYENFMESVKNTPGCLGKPTEWKYLYDRT